MPSRSRKTPPWRGLTPSNTTRPRSSRTLSATDQHSGLGAEEAGPGGSGAVGCRVDPGVVQDLPYSGRGSLDAEDEESPWMRRYPQDGFSFARRSTSRRMERTVRGRLGRRGRDLAAWRRASRFWCQRRTVSGRTSSLNRPSRPRGRRCQQGCQECLVGGRVRGRILPSCRSRTVTWWRRPAMARPPPSTWRRRPLSLRNSTSQLTSALVATSISDVRPPASPSTRTLRSGSTRTWNSRRRSQPTVSAAAARGSFRARSFCSSATADASSSEASASGIAPSGFKTVVASTRSGMILSGASRLAN